MAVDKLRVTIDLDATLVDSVGPAVAEFRRRGGIAPDIKDITVYDPRKLFRYPDDHQKAGFIDWPEVVSIWRAAWETPLDVVDKRIPGIISDMISRHSVEILSATTASPERVITFLRRHKIPYDNIIIVENDREKAERAGDIHIDDSPGAIAAVSMDKSRAVFVLRYPWNKTVTGGGNIHIFESWGEIADHHLLRSDGQTQSLNI